VWTACGEALHSSEGKSGGGAKTANGCKEHWLSLRKSYLAIKMLVNQSGWGWDDERKVVATTPEVWDTYIAAHPEMKKWRNTPFPHYYDLQALIEGRHATGERAYRVSLTGDDGKDDPSSTEDTEDVDDIFLASQSTNTASQDAAVRTPKPLRRKRSISSSPPPSLPALKRSKLSPRGPAVVQDVVNAIRQLSESMSTPVAMNTPSTPKRRQVAIEAVEHEATFTTPEQVKVWNLFYKDIAAADTYMAISDKRKRNRFVRGLLDMPASEPNNPFL